MTFRIKALNPIVLQPTSLLHQPEVSETAASSVYWPANTTWARLLADVDELRITASNPSMKYNVSDRMGNPIFYTNEDITNRKIPILQSATNKEIMFFVNKADRSTILMCKASNQMIARVSGNFEGGSCCCCGVYFYKAKDGSDKRILILRKKTIGDGWNIYNYSSTSIRDNNNEAAEILLGELSYDDPSSNRCCDDCCGMKPYTITVTFPKHLDVVSKAALFAIVQLMEFNRFDHGDTYVTADS